MRLITRTLAALACTLLVTTSAHAQLGDPDSFTDDPAALQHLGFTPFDDPELTWFHFDDLWQHEGVAYGGEGLIDNAACIPGMDSASFDDDPATECGGDNFYLVHDEVRTLTPLVPADQVGFFYGTPGDELVIEIVSSDGRAHEFVMMGGAEEGEGTAGYFAWGSGDPAVQIEQVAITSLRGAIDDVTVGMSYQLDADFQNVATDDLAQTCSVEGLAAAVAATPMDTELAVLLDDRMDQIVDWWQQRDMVRVVRGLELMAFHLELGRGDTIDSLDAEPLLACIETLLQTR